MNTETDCWISRLAFEVGEVELALTGDRADLVTAPDELRRAGFERHWRSERSCADLAAAVVAKANAGRPGADPDLIVWGSAIPANANGGSLEAYTDSRDIKHLMDFPASRLQARLGWERAVVVGLTQQACTTIVGGWRTAAALLTAEPDWTEAVCINADRLPEDALYEQAFNPLTDAATYARVSRTPEPDAYRVLAFHQITNGGMSIASDTQTAGAFFPWMHRAVTETLGRAGRTAADIDWVAPQNTHEAAWRVLGPLLGIDPAQVSASTRASHGHLIAGDNVANLVALNDSGQLRTGQTVLVTAAGYGANWQCALLEVGPR